jgi:hypothetical protein
LLIAGKVNVRFRNCQGTKRRKKLFIDGMQTLSKAGITNRDIFPVMGKKKWDVLPDSGVAGFTPV